MRALLRWTMLTLAALVTLLVKVPKSETLRVPRRRVRRGVALCGVGLRWEGEMREFGSKPAAAADGL